MDPESIFAALESKALAAKRNVRSLEQFITEVNNSGLADGAISAITAPLRVKIEEIIMEATHVQGRVRDLRVRNPIDPHDIMPLEQVVDLALSKSIVCLDEAPKTLANAKERKKAKDKKDEKKKSKEGKEAHEPPKKKLKTKDARNEAGGSN